jgi:hypothetical protein
VMQTGQLPLMRIKGWKCSQSRNNEKKALNVGIKLSKNNGKWLTLHACLEI